MDTTANTDMISIANRKAYCDLAFQRSCLASLIETDSIKQSSKEELKAILRTSYPKRFLPPPNSFPVIMRFNSQKVPHFEFHLLPQPVPKGCPDYDCDKDVAFYSAKIYNILKKDIDREDAMNGEGEDCAGDDGESQSLGEEDSFEEEDEAYQSAIRDNSNNNNNNPFTSTANISSSIRRTDSVGFNGELPTSAKNNRAHNPNHTLVNNSASSNTAHHRGSTSTPQFPIKQEPTESGVISIGKQIACTSNGKSSFKRKGNNLTNYNARKQKKQTTSRSGAHSPSEGGRDINIHEDPAWQSFVAEQFSESTDQAEVLVYSAVPAKDFGDKRKRLICPICRKVYFCEYLKDHINVIHLDKKPYHCKWKDCKYECGFESSARKHVQTRHAVPAKLAPKYVEWIEYID